MGTYAEFTASGPYREALAGALVGFRMICDADPSLEVTGLLDFSYNAETEQIPIEECGNEGTTEIVTGRVSYSFNLSLVIRPREIDNFLPTRATFLERQPWSMVAVYGPRHPAAIAALPDERVLFALNGMRFSSYNVQNGARGDVRGSVQGVAVEFLSGAEYAARLGA